MTPTPCRCGHVPNAHIGRICDHCPCSAYDPVCVACNRNPRHPGEHVCRECMTKIGPWG